MQKEGKMRKKNQGIHRKPLVIIFKLGHRYEITFSNNRMGEKFGVYGAGEQKKKKGGKNETICEGVRNFNITSEAVDVLICWNDLEKWM